MTIASTSLTVSPSEIASARNWYPLANGHIGDTDLPEPALALWLGGLWPRGGITLHVVPTAAPADAAAQPLIVWPSGLIPFAVRRIAAVEHAALPMSPSAVIPSGCQILAITA